MIPIPQYPLYSALITLYGGQQVGYYLDEESGWGFDLQATKDALAKARADGLNPKAFCVINPGNPTGQVMSVEDLTSIVKFCKEEKLMLLSDEVYQENIYGEGLKFTSMKKIVRDLGPAYDDFELASFHSTSKGLIGECGRRGGYMELCGFDSSVEGEIFKLACMGLCPNLDGQIMTGLMISQPKPGDASYELFNQEQTDVYDSLKRKAKMLVDALNNIEGFSCQTANGAMYAFPSIQLSKAAIAAAEAKGQAPDLFYCLALLEETGICCVPGSGFHQKPGTYHFRTTFLPPEEKLAEALVRFKAFHERFTAQYA
jgi:alanine transaminase